MTESTWDLNSDKSWRRTLLTISMTSHMHISTFADIKEFLYKAFVFTIRYRLPSFYTVTPGEGQARHLLVSKGTTNN